MRSLLTVMRDTKRAGVTGGILSRPAAAVTIAGSLSVLTLAASLYLFMFAGRDLLPPPPIAGLPASRILEPVPMSPIPSVAPGPEVPAVPAAPVLLSAEIPLEQAAVAQDGGTAGTVAGVSVAPSPDDDDSENDRDDDHTGSRSEEPLKNEKSEISSGDKSKISRYED